jgi:hypothetical protein
MNGRAKNVFSRTELVHIDGYGAFGGIAESQYEAVSCLVIRGLYYNEV